MAENTTVIFGEHSDRDSVQEAAMVDATSMSLGKQWSSERTKKTEGFIKDFERISGIPRRRLICEDDMGIVWVHCQIAESLGGEMWGQDTACRGLFRASAGMKVLYFIRQKPYVYDVG
jgi:hypothetical protein